MPNHVHLLVVVHDQEEKPLATLGQIVGYLKYVSTKNINKSSNTFGRKLWQRNYYEHVIRNEIDYLATWEYIENNPFNWALDEVYLD